jgi:DNA-directed RNA polymerase specialized sigma subunit
MQKIWDPSIPCSAYAGFRAVISLDAMLNEPGSGGDLSGIDIRDSAPSALDSLMSAEAADAVNRFVGKLREREREIVFRIFWLGETQADVARSLGVSKMAICKAMAKISELGKRRLAAYRGFALKN